MRPREVFRSEFTGRKSYLVNLGNLAFSSPSILGDVARQAGMSCGTCHVNGAGNAKFFMPKMSTRPGNFDTTGPLFNPSKLQMVAVIVSVVVAPFAGTLIVLSDCPLILLARGLVAEGVPAMI